MIRLQNLSIDYEVSARQKIAAATNVSAEFPAGKISVLLGASGCGKTSLLHVMAGLLKASGGEILLHEKSLTEIQKSTSIIFQDFGLLPWKTVFANAELPLKIISMKKKQRKEIVLSLLQEFGLEQFAASYPKQLSGGMKQRLAVARSLAANPDLLLMDEPFSSLDALTREDAQDFLLDINYKHNMTTIMVTHSIDEAVYLADKIFIMTGKNPGTIHQCIDVPLRDKKTFREDSRFQEYCSEIRNILKSEDFSAGNDHD
jgi:NitT/TauT family transport system ATP-binding protein